MLCDQAQSGRETPPVVYSTYLWEGPLDGLAQYASMREERVRVRLYIVSRFPAVGGVHGNSNGF